MNYYGFEKLKEETRELFPPLLRSASRATKRAMFLTQYNACVKKELRIPVNYCCTKKNLEEIFRARIEFLLKSTSTKNTKISQLCLTSNKLIHAYLNKKEDFFDIITLCGNEALHPAAKLIQMIYAKEQPGIRFDAEVLFRQFVFNKISCKHANKDVFLNNQTIIVEKDGKKLMGIMPYFKQISSNKVYLAQNEINKGLLELESQNLPILFLVFPRNENFKQHIKVKTCNFSDNYSKLKLVPYAISNNLIFYKE